MPTIYEDIPLIEERIEGASLIVVGWIEKLVDTRIDYTIDPPQVQTIYRVNVENVLKGEYDQSSLNIRVVGGKAKEAETEWRIQMKEGQQMLLMLAPDYGPNNGEDMFVPYFSSLFPVEKKGMVILDEQTAEELTSQQIPVEKARVKIADLRAIIDTLAQHREQELATLAELESVDLTEMIYDKITEMPQAEFGEPRSVSPVRLPEEIVDEDY